MLILKEGFGWSDEELYEAAHFNLLVRRSLGLMNLTDEVPVESTYYRFKQRLYAHQVESGSDLLKEVFQELTHDLRIPTKVTACSGDRDRLGSRGGAGRSSVDSAVTISQVLRCSSV